MLTMALAAAAISPAALPKLSVRGMDMVDPNGKKVLLKGCNLGNWLTMEAWMLDMRFRDQVQFEEILTERFGQAENERLMDLYRSSWITDRDFPIICSFGFNVVRLPMNYRLMEDDTNPLHLRKDAWQWIDKAVDMAERHGLYIILDMHGVQGGQSPYDHTGHSNQNKLWSVPENQERLAWLWGELAKRYRNRTAVVAYDVFNEPYGGSKPDQVKVFKLALAEIRKNDPDKLVYAHGNGDDWQHYGNPKANGWHNVGFQMHYYPGLFGNGEPTERTHAEHLRSIDEDIAPQAATDGVPFLIGEMNVVFGKAGGASMMRRTFDAHAKHGWATTMWAYKTLSQEGGLGDSSWCMVTNRQPQLKIDLQKSSKEEIEAWMRSFGTMEYQVNEPLRKALTDAHPVLPPLPELPSLLKSVPFQDALAGWSVVDLGGARKGGLKDEGSDAFTLYGGGSDIWGGRDQARFLYQPVAGDFELSVTVKELPAIQQWAKAGLMARESLDPSAATWLLSVFPSGGVQFAERASAVKDMAGKNSENSSLPVRLRLVRRGTSLSASFASGLEPWQELGSTEVHGSTLYIGAIALSHDNKGLIPIRYENLRLSH